MTENASWQTLHQSFYGQFPLQKSLEACQKRLPQEIKNLKLCPDAAQLWKKVEGQGLFSIHCAPQQYTPMGAATWMETRKIFIGENQNNFVTSMLFELNNLNRSQEHISLMKKICSLPQEEYVLSSEAYEYQTLKDSLTIFEKCIRENHWPIISSIVPLESFEDYLAKQEELGHSDMYRKIWQENCGSFLLQGFSEKVQSLWNTCVTACK